MRMVAWCFSVLAWVGVLGVASTAVAGGGLVDLLPDLIPGSIISVTETARTVRPSGVTPGATVEDTGFVYGTFTPQTELDTISTGAFKEFQNLPVGSAVAAFTYQFDPATNVFKRSEEGLGPIFADRAQSMGRGKLNFGVSYAHIDFDELEGIDLDSLPIPTVPTEVFVDTYSNTANSVFADQAHVRSNTPVGTPYPAQGVTFDVVPNGGVFEAFIDPFADFIPSPSPLEFLSAAGPLGQYSTFAGPSDLEANVDLEVELMNVYASYGVTEKFDIGILLPILRVELDATVSFTTIDSFGGRPLADGTTSPGLEAVARAQFLDSDYVGAFGNLAIDDLDANNCVFNTFDFPTQADQDRCLFDLGLADIYNQGVHELQTGGTFDSRTAQRDFVSAVTFIQQVKDSGTNTGIGDLVIRGKYAFLESRFVDMAGRLDISFPTGSEKNFRSTGEYMWGVNLIMSKAFGYVAPHANLSIQARTGGKENHQFRWAVGTDVKLHERVAVSVDFVGSEDLYHDGIGDQELALAAGIKINPIANLILSAAAIIRLNHQGLRSDVIPTVGIEYSFF